jgi:hypothetical protein
VSEDKQEKSAFDKFFDYADKVVDKVVDGLSKTHLPDDKKPPEERSERSEQGSSDTIDAEHRMVETSVVLTYGFAQGADDPSPVLHVFHGVGNVALGCSRRFREVFDRTKSFDGAPERGMEVVACGRCLTALLSMQAAE